MKKKKKLFITLIVLLVIGVIIKTIIYGPWVSIRERIEVKKFAENYLTMKYGEHKFKVTNIEYEYNMEILFDYSDPKGYWVEFKSDIVKESWLTIDGLYPDEIKVKNDYLLEDYYFPGADGHDVYESKKVLAPKKEYEDKLLNTLKNEFDSDIINLSISNLSLDLPSDYGKVPSFEEFQTNTELYKPYSFSFESRSNHETNYLNKLKSYIYNKYGCSSNIYISETSDKVDVNLNF